MSKIELLETNSGYNLQKINSNFQKIEEEFNDKVLYRDNPNGEPNEMNNDLDMNGNRIYNLPTPAQEHEAARLKDVQNAVADAAQANLVGFAPYGDLQSTNVQGAIQELEDGKVATADLASDDEDKGAAMVGFDPNKSDYPADSAGGALSVLIRSTGKRRNLRYFGASASDGSADVSAALTDAIESGEPLLFENGLYRLEAPVLATVNKLDIHSDIAEFFYPDSQNNISHLIDIHLTGDLDMNPSVTGSMWIDGRFNCGSAIRIYNRDSDYIDRIVLEGLSVRNLKKHDQNIISDGITVRGGFRYVLLDRPFVDTIEMAPGAGVLGVSGVTGIVVHQDTVSGLYPIRTEIRSPYINKIYSADPSYTSDQDGIKVFGFVDSVNSEDSSCLISGGSFTNCWGRSIKLQTRTGTVIGSKFRRSEGFTRGYGNPEIDFQAGGGQVSDINCFYTGTGPSNLVLFSNHASRRGFPGLVKNVTIFSTGTTLEPLVTNQHRNVYTGEISVSGIQLQGTARAIVDLVGSSVSSARLSISDCFVHELTEALVLAKGVSGVGCQISARGNMNAGPAVPLVLARIPGNATDALLNDLGNIGFTVSPRVGLDADLGGITRVHHLTGHDMTSGSMRFQSQIVANGATASFESHGYFDGVCCALVTVNQGKQSSVLVGISPNAGCQPMTSGSNIEVSTTQSEPSTGIFRVWSPDGSLRFRNESGSSRVVTVMFFG